MKSLKEETMRRFILLVLVFSVFCRPVSPAAAKKPYFFPYVNPFEATVMEVPPIYVAELPEKVPTKVFTLKVFPERKIPGVFWYEKGLNCSLVYQKHKAPLVFVIAGTGARYNSPKMINLQRALYSGGFHVISITSPTHMHFVVNASGTMVPGNVNEDARDLYRVMELALENLPVNIEISEFYMTGYSLGGIQAAFVANLDEELKKFNFQKVLLINPPVNLYNSVTILDRLMTEHIPGGTENFNAWFADVMRNLAEIEEEMGYVELTGQYLYKVYKRFPPDEDVLAALVGLSFRMDSANMIFAADIMNGGGFITPKNAEFTNSTSLTPYAMVAYRTSFPDYFHEYFYPIFREREPGLKEQELIERMSLRQIDPYLRSSGKISLIHNEDDIIMAPGEIDYLRQVFGDRAMIYPTGGHCGNMNHPDVVRFFVNFFKGQED